ncbi:XRE family transcriptional regulator [Hamadaea tsunoensis]|uniref:XRE family transcriptional regulator n=1 Tax=Hamadaea tsunoensis TaxID=53368 RepID=UPI00040D0699|nr:XRE family transcriptional regulator [Hamadaea tsunoensis]
MKATLTDRVRTLIDQVSGSQTAFGDLIGMSKDKLSKSLAGTRRFTSLELALIAEAGDVSVDWLLTGRSPERPAVAARSAVAPAPAGLADRYADAYEVLDLLGRTRAVPPLPDAPATTGMHDRGTALATAAVDRLARHRVGPVSGLGAAELVAAVEEVFGVDVAVGELPPGLDGLSWQTDQRRLILLAATQQWTRQRFTLAHELGHLLGDDARQVVVDRHVSPGVDRDPTEVSANSFAAALLMPEAEVRARAGGALTDDEFARLVVDFQVSPSAMAVRLFTLEIVGPVRFEQLRATTALACHQRAGSIEEYLDKVNAALAQRLPTRLVGDLFAAYQEGATTLRPLANLLGVDVDDLYETLAGTPADTAPDAVFSL